MFENVILAEIEGVKYILSDDIKSGDEVIGYFEKPVNSYWVKDCVARNNFDEGDIKNQFLIFKNGISCGVANNPFYNQKWFKVLGTLNNQKDCDKGENGLLFSTYAKKKLEYIVGHSIVRDFPNNQPTLEWAGAVLDLLEDLKIIETR
jgi:hypothetical protein